jgi:hypothetical protein
MLDVALADSLLAAQAQESGGEAVDMQALEESIRRRK